MKTLKYLYHNYTKAAQFILLLCFIVAFGRILIIKATNIGLSALMVGDPVPIQGALMVFLGIMILLFVQPLYYKKSVTLLEQFVIDYRLRIGSKIKEASLHSIEYLGEHKFFDALAYQSGFILQRSFVLVMFTQAILEWFLIITYTAIYISVTTAFGVFIIVLLLAFLVQLTESEEKRLNSEIDKVNESYAASIKDSVLGFKELKVNYKKQQDLQKAQQKYLTEFHKLIPKILGISENINYYGQVLNYGFLGIFFFLVPTIFQLPVSQVLPVAVAFLFLSMPLFRIVGHWTVLPFIDASLDLMLNLDQILSHNIEKNHAIRDKEVMPFTEKLVLQNITFTYTNKDGYSGYTLGPTDLEIRKGEVLFIIGGNGSGKSTMLKVLTSLYPASGGEIYVDDQKVTNERLAEYRELFVAIFTDFYLPNRLLGVDRVNQNKVRQLLKLFGLSGKTDIDGDSFTTTDLSTGQRKRLAMVTSFLENKSIYIFDEVAADQDPDHRKLFYDFILSDMKKAGKTCIVVSHDDHYFHKADRILEMKHGKLSPYELHVQTLES